MTYSLEGCCARSFQFNSRTREGCDTTPTRSPSRTSSFNSRTREGCDIEILLDLLACLVSIHTPVRGATGTADGYRERSKVSIHAPVRGATNPKRFTTLCNAFQFTHPRGVRRHLR